MSSIVFVLAGVLACAMVLVVGWRYYRRRARPVSVKRLSFIQPFPRKLTAEERAAIEHYFHHSQPLAPRSDNVYSVTHAITRYGLATDAPHKWLYYLDNIEIHLPAQWEQFIAEENHVELIRTDSMPLVISLNGHSLVNYTPSAMAPARWYPTHRCANRAMSRWSCSKCARKRRRSGPSAVPPGDAKRCFAARRGC